MSLYRPAFFLFFLGMLFSVTNLYSVGAFPDSRRIIQPDGSEITIKVNGDEWFNWISTIDGYRIALNDDDIYEYITLLKSGEPSLSGIAASNPHERSSTELDYLSEIEKGSLVSPQQVQNIRNRYREDLLKSVSDNVFPAEGEQNMLVILANFSDTNSSYSPADFDDFMNQEGYAGTGSFRDYYLEVSNGALDVNSVVTQWVDLPNSSDYYSSRDRWGEFAYQSVLAASNAGVDFSQFDNNGNGIIEGIAIIHTGPGQEVTGDESHIWSHSWTLSAAGYSESMRTFDGVKVDRYTVQPETHDEQGNKNSIGVICHEFGHNLGLPDYYDTNDNSYPGTGNWDLMARGTYNGETPGSLPAHHNPYSKMELGWIPQPQVISTAGELVLEPVIESQKVFLVESPYSQEYLLLENRRQIGFDSFIPGEGLLIYHVDEERIDNRRSSNNINTEEHQGLMVISASGVVNSATAPFPGSFNKTEFTDDSDPAAITWSGEPFDRSITSIRELDNNIIFDYMAVQSGAPLSFMLKSSSPNSVEVEWSLSANLDPVLLAWSEDGVFGEPEDGVDYSNGDILPSGGEVLYYGDAEEFIHLDLEPGTIFHYKIWSDLGDTWSPALEKSVQTMIEPVDQFPWNDSFEDGLTNWSQHQVSGVFSWEQQTIGTSSNPSSAYDGDFFAYFFVDDYNPGVTRLTSPLMNFDDKKNYLLEFRHFQREWDGDQDFLRVLYRGEEDEEWIELACYNSNEYEWIERRLLLPNEGAGYIAFEGTGKYGYGIAVDDVTVKSTLQKPYNGEGEVYNISLDNRSEDLMALSWDKSNDVSLLVVVREGNKVVDLPELEYAYEGNSVFGEGEDIGSHSYVVSSGDNSNVTVTGLDHSTRYYFAFFVYDSEASYSYHPLQTSYFTETVDVNLTYVVTDSDGKDLQGAYLNVEGESTVTDSNGNAYWVQGYSEEFYSAVVKKQGFYTRAIRYIPDKSKTIEIELSSLDKVKPSNFTAHFSDNLEAQLSWDPVINEDFSNYEPFSLSLPGWIMKDYDESPTWALQDLSFPNEGYVGAFILFDPHYSTLLQSDFDMTARYGENLLASFASRERPNDDWLISPRFTVDEKSVLSIDARTLSPLYSAEKIRVLISPEGGSDKDSFEMLHEEIIEVPTEWTRYRFSLDQYRDQQVRIAVNCVTDDGMALFIDKIKVASDSDIDESIVSVASESGDFDNQTSSYKSGIKRAAYEKQKVVTEKGRDYLGGIDYRIWINDEPVGEVSGFSSVDATVEAFECCDNIFSVSTIYNQYDSESNRVDFLIDYLCSPLVVEVVDMDGHGVAGALVVISDQESLITDSEGVALFEDYKLSATGTIEISFDDLEPIYVDYDLSVDNYVNVELTNYSTYTDNNLADDINKLYRQEGTNIFIAEVVPFGDVTVETYDVTGRVAMLTDFNYSGGQFEIDMSHLNSGIYVVVIKANGEIVLRETVILF
ncbi:M6 family metalloprotease domain-containing protein [Marinilabiliaceae bacterium ANBcel2]|nr:M6 family metalloprotease domain-containing protein [Marinilabiliaceae bacterium ANBcel2]